MSSFLATGTTFTGAKEKVGEFAMVFVETPNMTTSKKYSISMHPRRWKTFTLRNESQMFHVTTPSHN
ncbi:hypothetical protein NC653_007166 [Populus alba x Populus x berolinensis]|uniref:Uncharacterized protein n=1 Tax=Populus alba x Populus x berolinensis TaxID=444605 RepID=A0AAD6RH93_9ROSI|nr:hypothetical protein NC653_007166 [Populus alba x Populus x berolinensis]